MNRDDVITKPNQPTTERGMDLTGKLERGLRIVGADDLGDEARIPLSKERLRVGKQAVVTGEVVVDKEQRTERGTVGDTIRREEVEVDHAEGTPVHHRQGHIPHSNER
jgi:hypothetical protein